MENQGGKVSSAIAGPVSTLGNAGGRAAELDANGAVLWLVDAEGMPRCCPDCERDTLPFVLCDGGPDATFADAFEASEA